MSAQKIHTYQRQAFNAEHVTQELCRLWWPEIAHDKLTHEQLESARQDAVGIVEARKSRHEARLPITFPLA